MECTVEVFVIPRERAPGGLLEPAREFTVEAPTVDGPLAVRPERLAARSSLARSDH